MKRTFDFFSVFAGLCILAPALLGISLLVRVKLGSPILFRQQRPGMHGLPFMMYKFRTMTDERDAIGDTWMNKYHSRKTSSTTTGV